MRNSIEGHATPCRASHCGGQVRSFVKAGERPDRFQGGRGA